MASPLYAIADVDALAGLALDDVVLALVKGGARWIQVRAKSLFDDELYRQAARVRERLESQRDLPEVTLWMNDRADVARLLCFEGVHLGQSDLPPAAARRIVPRSCMVGLSTHGPAQVREAHHDPAVDVVAIGPVFGTRSKNNPDPVVGLAGVREARAITNKPLVAIGGVDAENAPGVLSAGADAVAVIGALLTGATAASEVERRTEGFLARLR